MTAPEPDVAAIAKGLTKAQREVMPHMFAEWQPAPDLRPWIQAATVIAYLVGKGLAEKHRGFPQYRLTPLGLLVRAHLLAERPTDAG